MMTKSKNPNCPNCQTSLQVTLREEGKFQLYFCGECKNGFVYPIPRSLDKFYPSFYWQFPGQLAGIREGLHRFFQQRRKSWVLDFLSKGHILDVGAGEGVFGEMLGPQFQVTNLETPNAQVQNPNVIKADFLKWNTNKRFDGIVFLESLEHVPSPQKYLEKAAKLLKPAGYILVECPSFDSIESKLFGKHWVHRDIPRHLSQLSNRGVKILASRNNLKVIKQTGILSFEYSPMCFIFSSINLLNIQPLNLRVKSWNNLKVVLFSLMILPLAFLAETIFYLIDQAPTELTILAKKTLR